MNSLVTSRGPARRERGAAATPKTAAGGAGDEDATQLVSHPTAASSLPGVKVTSLGGGAGTGQQIPRGGRSPVIAAVGRGGMASVYKAFDPGIERTIALKFLHASLCQDEQYRSRFIREARAAGLLPPHNLP